MGRRVEIRVPKMGMDTTEVVISKWHVGPDDDIVIGKPLVELESEKVTFTVVSEYAGQVVEVPASVGATVPVGGVLCVLETSATELTGEPSS